LLNRTWEFQRATATNILAVSQAPNSSKIIFQVTLALQTDNQGRRFLATDSFQKNASVLMFGKLNLL
jgi:hypothetical protein